jgi:hypothetical protein
MTDSEFDRRLKRLEEDIQGEHSHICPSCGYGRITIHHEHRHPDGTLYYVPPFPQRCEVCKEWKEPERKPGDGIRITHLIIGMQDERPQEEELVGA